MEDRIDKLEKLLREEMQRVDILMRRSRVFNAVRATLLIKESQSVNS